MITQEDYRKAQKTVDEYKLQQLNLPVVSNCGTDKNDKIMEWWQELIENDLCDYIEKKHGFYGHDIGSTKEDIAKMYEMECNCC